MRRNTSGASLLEVVIATALAAILLLAVFQLFPSSLLALRQGRDRVSVSDVAQDVMER